MGGRCFCQTPRPSGFREDDLVPTGVGGNFTPAPSTQFAVLCHVGQSAGVGVGAREGQQSGAVSSVTAEDHLPCRTYERALLPRDVFPPEAEF